MVVPKSFVLRGALGWLAYAAVASLMLRSFAPADTAEAAGSFFIRTILPHFCGALGSGSAVVWVPALGLATVFAATILIEPFQSRTRAHWAFGAFALLSLFTIWFDNILVSALNPVFSTATAEAVAQTAVSSMVSQYLTVPLAMAFTAVWVFVWVVVVREMDAELDESVTRRDQKREIDTLLRESLGSPISSGPAVKPPPVRQMACEACGFVLASTNRFCTRCGAPLKHRSENAGEAS